MFRKPFKQWTDQYLNFNRKDRNAILVLSFLILLVLIGHIIVENVRFNSEIDHSEIQAALAEWKNLRKKESKKYLFSFNPNTVSSEKLDSLAIPEFVKKNIISYRDAGGRFNRAEDLRKIYGINDSIYSRLEKFILIDDDSLHFSATINNSRSRGQAKKKKEGYFDPNTAQQDLLYDFGFNSFQASNIIKYREKGGKFERPADLLRIYGMDSSFYLSIQKNIKIHPTQKKLSEIESLKIRIELNSADSADLVKLKGIGPVFAVRIIKFRDVLGGYYLKEQLLEVYNFPEETFENIVSQIYVDTLGIKKIRLNFADFGELLRHPYLNQGDVSAIISYREENGAFDSVSRLNTRGILNVETFKKIKPYLSCR